MSAVTIIKEYPATYQASCSRCGWHTRPTSRKRTVEWWAGVHEKACPNPLPPRSGMLMECGCWWHGLAGSKAGRTRAECPRHGDVLSVQANVDEPTGEALSFQWTRPEGT